MRASSGRAEARAEPCVGWCRASIHRHGSIPGNTLHVSAETDSAVHCLACYLEWRPFQPCHRPGAAPEPDGLRREPSRPRPVERALPGRFPPSIAPRSSSQPSTTSGPSTGSPSPRTARTCRRSATGWGWCPRRPERESMPAQGFGTVTVLTWNRDDEESTHMGGAKSRPLASIPYSDCSCVWRMSNRNPA